MQTTMLVEENSVCVMSIGPTVHSLGVFLLVKDGFQKDHAEREFTKWLSGRVLQSLTTGTVVQCLSLGCWIAEEQLALWRSLRGPKRC